MDKKSITIYQTHIEVYPYKLGECEDVERLYTVYDPITHSRYTTGIAVLNDTLYVPRGTSITLLKRFFNSDPRYVNRFNKPKKFKCPVSMVNEPRDDVQKTSIRFLDGEGEFKNSLKYPQLGLNLETEFGKTFCTISHIVHTQQRALIVVHNDTVKHVWLNEFKKHTDISPDRLISVDGTPVIEKILNGKVDGDIYVVCHRSIQSYGDKYGWDKLNDVFIKMGIGTRVTDEAHLEFYNTIMMDLFSNIRSNIYLTANFSRGNPAEIKVYKRCFSSLHRFGENINSKRKHIIGYILKFKSGATELDEATMSNFYGFNPGLYMDYELFQNKKIIKVFEYILRRVNSLEGKIVIITPKKTHTEKIKELVDNMDLGRTCTIVNSDNTPEVNEANKEADIISTTIKSLGTGDNIKGLRTIICLEPIGQEITCNQLSGRLRELNDVDDNFFILITDDSIGNCRNKCKNSLRVFKKKFKKIIFEEFEE